MRYIILHYIEIMTAYTPVMAQPESAARLQSLRSGGGREGVVGVEEPLRKC